MSDQKYTLTVREFAQRLGVSMPTAYQLCNRADFPLLRIGRRMLIPVERLEEWIRAHAGGDVIDLTNAR